MPENPEKSGKIRKKSKNSHGLQKDPKIEIKEWEISFKKNYWLENSEKIRKNSKKYWKIPTALEIAKNRQ